MIRHHELKDTCTVTGLALIVAGTVSGLAALISQLAWALPLSELLTRAGMSTALLFLLPGVWLVRMGRGGRPGRRAQRHAIAPGLPSHRAA